MQFRVLAIIFQFLFIPCLFSQQADDTLWQSEKKAEIETTLQQYLYLTRQKKYGEVLDYIHPKLFDVVSRQAIQDEFENLDKDENMRIAFGDGTIRQISDLVSWQNRLFAKVDYTFEMTVFFFYDDMLDIMFPSFQQQFGNDRVARLDEERAIRVRTEKSLFSIKESWLDGWKFIENNPEQRFILESILPKNILDHFNNHENDN